MKLEVRIKGSVADLKPGGSYELQLNNPMSELETILGSRGMNLELADSVNNRDILNWINDHLNIEAVKYLPCEQYGSGNLLDVGFVYVRDARKPIKLDYSSYLSEFFGTYQKLKLSEIDFGLLGASTWNATLSNTWAVGGYVLPTVLDSVFFKDNTPPVGWDAKINSYATGSYLTDTPKVPMFFLKHILKSVGDLAGVTFHGSVWDDSEFAKLFVFNNVTAGLNTEKRLHMPDVTVAELLLGLKKWLNVAVMFDIRTGKVRLEYAEVIRNKAAAVDWSDKFARLKGGMPDAGAALLLQYDNDGNDALAKRDFLSSYIMPGLLPNETSVKSLSSNIVPLVMSAGSIAAEVVGAVGVSGKGNNNTVRVGRWNGAADTADNNYGSVLMSREGLYYIFWSKTDQILQNVYVVEEPAALDANDIAWISACFTGQGSLNDIVPIVHVQGADWEVLSVTVPFGNSRLSRVKMRRI